MRNIIIMDDFNREPDNLEKVHSILSFNYGKKSDIIKNLRIDLKSNSISQLAAKLMTCIQCFSETITEEQAYEVINVLAKNYSLGWKNGIYKNANPCLEFKGAGESKKNCLYYSCQENFQNGISLYEQLKDTKKLLQNKTYGSFITFIFAYCLCSTFTSLLKENGIYFPYFLQVIIRKGSEAYFLIRELSEISDVNVGLYRYGCNFNMSNCINEVFKLYPNELEESKKVLDHLKDIPVLILDENRKPKKNYQSLLQELSSVTLENRYHNKVLKSHLNILPIFITESEYANYSTIKKIHFDKIIENQDIECIELLIKQKNFLSSLVFGFIDCFPEEKIIKKINQFTKNSIKEEVNETANELFSKNLTLNNPMEIKSLSLLKWLLDSFFSYILNRVKELYGRQDDNSLFKNIEAVLRDLILICEQNLLEMNSLIFTNYSYQFVKQPDKLNDTKEDRVNYLKYLFLNLELHIKVTDYIEKKNAIIYKISPIFGTSQKQINNKLDDIRMRMKSEDITLDACYKDAGLELIHLHDKIEIVNIEEVLNNKENPISNILKKEKIKIPYIVGYDYHDNLKILDLHEINHMLIGGTTGSGKSIAVHALLLSVITQTKPSDVRFILMDFKQGQTFRDYKNIPHLATKIIIDKIEAMEALDWLNEEMDRRHKLKKLDKEPEIICIMEEVLSMFHDDKETKEEIVNQLSNLFEKGRSAKIHLILIAQNADENVRKSSIIRNITTKVVLKTSNARHAYNIAGLAETSAHLLRGKGDMYLLTDDGKLRLQGVNVLEETVESVTNQFKTKPSYLFETGNTIIDDIDTKTIPKIKNSSSASSKTASRLDNKILVEIILQLFESKKISKNKIQSTYHIAFDTASSYIEKLLEIDVLCKGKGKTGYYCNISSYEEIPEEMITFIQKYQKIDMEQIKNYFK